MDTGISDQISYLTEFCSGGRRKMHPGVYGGIRKGAGLCPAERQTAVFSLLLRFAAPDQELGIGNLLNSRNASHGL